MKKYLMLTVMLVFAMLLILTSCGNQTIDSDKTGDTSNNIQPQNSNIDENSNSTVNSDNSTNLQNPPEENPVEQPNDNKDNLVEVKLPVVSYSYTQNNEYYSSAKFVSNTYYHSLSYEFGEWYKIVKSYEELIQIDSEATVDAAIFEENYILVVHRHYNGGLYYNYIGYKNAQQTEEGFEITLDCYEPEEDWTDQYRVVESIEYLVVSKTELENVSASEGKLLLNYNERDFYERVWYSISEEKASELENGNIWIFNGSTEYVELMESYGVSRPSYSSSSRDYTRVVIYLEKGTNIGIGFSNCSMVENEFYITNETLEGENEVLLEPALCVIIIPKPISLDKISNYNVTVKENIVERLYLAKSTVQVRKYYREISSAYTTLADGVVWENDQIFLDGVFEKKQASQYKVISSSSELQRFTLLNRAEIEESIFDNNYIVAILHYYIGPSFGAREPVGFYNADFNAEQKIILDTFYNYQYSSTEDERDIYRLHFIVVPKEEVSNAEEIEFIEINVNELEQYNMRAYAVDTKTEEVKAYCLNNEEDKQKLDILNSVEHFWIDSPCIAIHLSETIKTDFIVNDFKYENGEIFITVEIFKKTEMNYLHQISSNLILVSLRPHRGDLTINVPDNIPTECKVNVVFKNVVSVN